MGIVKGRFRDRMATKSGHELFWGEIHDENGIVSHHKGLLGESCTSESIHVVEKSQYQGIPVLLLTVEHFLML